MSTEPRDVEPGASRELERLRALSSLSKIGLLQLDPQWQCVYANEGWEALSGFSLDETRGATWLNAVGPDYRDKLLARLHGAWSQHDYSFSFEAPLYTPLGQQRWVSIQLRWLTAGTEHPEHVLLIVLDIDAQHRANELLQQQVTTDPLTGLVNRHALIQAAQRAIREWRPERNFSLLYIDLDGFKPVNDAYGHAAGDELLATVAQRLLSQVRSDDIVARLGGDEFAILLRQIWQASDLEAIASKIQHNIAAPIRINRSRCDAIVSASIGIASFTGWDRSEDGSDTPTNEDVQHVTERLLTHADTAMYRAKDSGRNTFRFYDPLLDEESRKVAALGNTLHRAVEHFSFDFHYQPQIGFDDLGAARLDGYEALLRLPRDLTPTGSSTSEFIPLLESSGLMARLGPWLIDRAIADHAQYLQARPGSRANLSINLSTVQFRDGRLIECLAGALSRHNITPQSIVLEVTERVLMDKFANIQAQLRSLREMGFRVSLDDFGTGFSSLSHLHRHPIDQIKVDRSFIGDLDSAEAYSIVRAILGLGRALNRTVVAEGVELRSQKDTLLGLGCGILQGWLFSPAMPLSRLILLEDGDWGAIDRDRRQQLGVNT